MMHTKMRRLLLIEDHLWFRQALALFLDGEPDLHVVAQAGTLAECRRVLLDNRLEDVDVAIIDLTLPDGDGIDVIHWLRGHAPRIAVLVLTVSFETEKHDLALRAGAEAVISKSDSMEDIVATIRRLAGSPAVPRLTWDAVWSTGTWELLPWRDYEQEAGETRILVAFEDEYRAYQEALASALRTLRPRAEVSTTCPEKAPDPPSRSRSDLVICNRIDSGEELAWLELSMKPGRPSNLRIGEQRSRIANPSLEEILSVVDEVERLIDTTSSSRSP